MGKFTWPQVAVFLGIILLAGVAVTMGHATLEAAGAFIVVALAALGVQGRGGPPSVPPAAVLTFCLALCACAPAMVPDPRVVPYSAALTLCARDAPDWASYDACVARAKAALGRDAGRDGGALPREAGQ